MSGSGKTQQRRLALRMLIEMKKQPQYLQQGVTEEEMRGGGSDVGDRILAGERVISELISAKVGQSYNASRAGVYQEIMFDEEEGSVVGGKTRVYMLETSRIANRAGVIGDEEGMGLPGSPGGGMGGGSGGGGSGSGRGKGKDGSGSGAYSRGFKVFRTLINGAPENKREEYGIDSKLMIGGESEYQLRMQYQEEYDEMVQSLKKIGLGGKMTDSIFKVIAGIMALSKVRFKRNQGGTGGGSYGYGYGYGYGDRDRDRDRDMGGQGSLGLATKMGDIPGLKNLGITEQMLQEILTTKTKEIGNEDYAAEGIQIVPVVKYKDRTECLDVFMRPHVGLFSLMSKQVQVITRGNKKDIEEFNESSDEQQQVEELYNAFVNNSENEANEYFINSSGVIRISRASTSLTGANRLRDMEEEGEKEGEKEGKEGKEGSKKPTFGSGGKKGSGAGLYNLSRHNRFGVAHYWGQEVYNMEEFVEFNREDEAEELSGLYLGKETRDYLGNGGGTRSKGEGAMYSFIGGLFTQRENLNQSKISGANMNISGRGWEV
ncbi:Chitin synthase 8 [Zancudomyces culisetae]|uniref:Chitin synthase 8 n=1 Tax=Zancudomyces culisetae TaxID=1213189 RepID=A0A1R1PWZ3_ZANCU|nr:Chitin synthase 8 [Zancudomyces culisetae]|eukprot:OMH85490.1 Chitin synthase 8 [Zancudomyces culisetae]